MREGKAMWRRVGALCLAFGLVCTARAACTTGQTCCDGALGLCVGGASCYDVQNDVANCGGCGKSCGVAPTNGGVSCVAGKCTTSCNNGYTFCTSGCCPLTTANAATTPLSSAAPPPPATSSAAVVSTPAQTTPAPTSAAVTTTSANAPPPSNAPTTTTTTAAEPTTNPDTTTGTTASSSLASHTSTTVNQTSSGTATTTGGTAGATVAKDSTSTNGATAPPAEVPDGTKMSVIVGGASAGAVVVLGIAGFIVYKRGRANAKKELRRKEFPRSGSTQDFLVFSGYASPTSTIGGSYVPAGGPVPSSQMPGPGPVPGILLSPQSDNALTPPPPASNISNMGRSGAILSVVGMYAEPPSLSSTIDHSQAAPHWLFVKIAKSLGMMNEDSVPFTGPQLRVMEDHIPTEGDEVALAVGQTVELREVFRDGWSVGWNIDDVTFGIMPLDRLDLSGYGESSHLAPKSMATASRISSRSVAIRSVVFEERDRLRAGTSSILSSLGGRSGMVAGPSGSMAGPSGSVTGPSGSASGSTRSPGMSSRGQFSFSNSMVTEMGALQDVRGPGDSQSSV